jgi:cob(I)alamin adenosyltransferase
MPRITKVYTRTGDDGTTALGGGQRLPKDALRVEAYGIVDELNSHLGVVRCAALSQPVEAALTKIQNDLFHLGSDLCILESDKQHRMVPVIEERHVVFLEDLIDRASESLAPLENFVLPGGSLASAQLHLARTVCRRAERLLVTLDREEPLGDFVLQYVNRLSDALFVLARAENQAQGFGDVLWDSRA